MKNEIHFPLDSLPLIVTSEYSMDYTPSLHPDRVMPCHVLLYVTQGMFSVVEDGEEYFVHAGNLLFLKAGLRHYGLSPCSPDRRWFYIHFSPRAAFRDDFPATSFPIYRTLEFSERDYQYNMVLPKMLQDETGKVERSISEIATLFASRAPLRHIRCSQMLFSLLLQISTTTQEAVEPRYSAHVEKLISFIENNLTQSITSEDISARFQLNSRYLSTLFKRETGSTVHQFQKTMRINKACKLLRYTSMNIQEVGSAVGYPDPCHFSHVFKVVMGVSPKSYLMQYK